MGVQLIFVVESNKACKSDWIYVKSTLDRFYEYNPAHVKLSPVYLDGKTKYNKKQKDVISLIHKYADATSGNTSIVLYCFDCDDYDINREDADFLESAKSFCRKNNYYFVWFCKDVERVFLGRKISGVDKKKEAVAFKAKQMITKVSEDMLKVQKYKANLSNILRILDELTKQGNLTALFRRK